MTFSVYAPGPRLTIVAATDDADTAGSALAPYRRPGDNGDGLAAFSGMPVEAVRSYCRLHGGVAQTGETARILLQALPSEADAPPAPAPAAEAPITDSRAKADKIREQVAAGTHDFLGRPLTPEQLRLDDLTPAVIEARRVAAEVERPLVPGLGYGDTSPRVAALEWRAEQAGRAASRLSLVDRPRYAAHPLRDEAIALRDRLADAKRQALAEIARQA
ncbi:hypothetical protein [Methylobacterium tardum]|uniref:hypothetical protein n=1 Tax=Methylobacterium tardum TaxID=374432 RepID=UPI001EDE0FE8|nr:hypothetical protein [Methylobacterium tardum]